MAGRVMRQGVTTRTNWYAVVSAFVLVCSVVWTVLAYYYENWYAMAGAGIAALWGLGLALLAQLDAP